MHQRFAQNDWEGGLLAGIDAVSKYFDMVYFDKGYTLAYWKFMVCSAFALALGLAFILFGQVKNQSKEGLDKVDAKWAKYGCGCYVIAALVSAVGIYMMADFERFWDPDAEDATLSLIPLYAGFLCLCGVPMCCPLACGTVLRDGPLNNCSVLPQLKSVARKCSSAGGNGGLGRYCLVMS